MVVSLVISLVQVVKETKVGNAFNRKKKTVSKSVYFLMTFLVDKSLRMGTSVSESSNGC